MKFAFRSNYYGLWTDEARRVYNFVLDCVRAKKPFIVEVRPEGEVKTPLQLRAIHKLCDLCQPHLEKEHNVKYDRSKVKDFLKYELGYTRPASAIEVALMLKSAGIGKDHPERAQAEEFLKKSQKPESFALATKEKMIELMEGIMAYAAQQGWEGVKLENQDLIASLTYFERG